ncbi:MAG TPA: HNH endonuclease signature motif containing protein [Pirellulales bacterium]|nr:HNH endonuclease signature motif containing protein [Pirellulales bacterium]
MPQSGVDIRFHVEHIIARQHRGDDSLNNLALACDRCNFLKGPNIASTDEDGTVTRLFHPRQDAWDDHFCLVDAEIVGITPIGRATARLFEMNAPRRWQLRASLLEAGTW